MQLQHISKLNKDIFLHVAKCLSESKLALCTSSNATKTLVSVKEQLDTSIHLPLSVNHNRKVWKAPPHSASKLKFGDPTRMHIDRSISHDIQTRTTTQPESSSYSRVPTGGTSGRGGDHICGRRSRSIVLMQCVAKPQPDRASMQIQNPMYTSSRQPLRPYLRKQQ